MRQYIQGLAGFLGVLAVVAVLVSATGTAARADILDAEAALSDRALGAPDAPVTIIEYSSLGCPHCKSFHMETLPTLKKEYIDTGKVRLVYRDYPLGGRALAAAMIARCAPKDRYFGMIELFFRHQEEWARAENALEAILKVARFGGLGEAEVNACLDNEKLLEGIRGMAQEAQRKYEIDSTPSFIVGEDETKIAGAMPIEAFREAIEEQLN